MAIPPKPIKPFFVHNRQNHSNQQGSSQHIHIEQQGQWIRVVWGVGPKKASFPMAYFTNRLAYNAPVISTGM
jgi:hypothetical protein